MQKKSLINTLKSTKKANVITAPAKNEGGASRKALFVKKAQLGRMAKFNVN